MLKKMATMAAALALVAGSVAPAMAAQPLSVANAPEMRASADTADGNELNGSLRWTRLAVLLAIGAAILIVAVVLNDDDRPDSP